MGVQSYQRAAEVELWSRNQCSSDCSYSAEAWPVGPENIAVDDSGYVYGKSQEHAFFGIVTCSGGEESPWEYAMYGGGASRYRYCPPGFTMQDGLCRRPRVAECAGNCPVGGPIVAYAQEKRFQHLDLMGVSGLTLERHYSSQSLFGLEKAISSFGPMWASNWDHALRVAPDRVDAVRANGRVFTFKRSGSEWNLLGGGQAFLRLDAGGTWTLSPSQGVWEHYDSDGRLLIVDDIATGERFVLDYDASGGLISVSDKYGRGIEFVRQAFEGGDRIIEARLGAQSVFYEYDQDTSEPRLVRSYDHIGSRYEYLYAEAGLSPQPFPDYRNGNRYLLTGVLDAEGNRISTVTYDPYGMAVISESAEGVNGYHFGYSQESVDITIPGGAWIRRRFEDAGYQIRPTGDDKHCPLCGPSYKSILYDTAGRIWQVADFNEGTTQFGYDPTGLETNRVQAVGTSVQRVTETDHDPVWRLPVERRVYGLGNVLASKSAWTYNTRGQALTQVRTDPATSATRTTTTTYCEQADIGLGVCPLLGLVLSVDGPRTDVNDITTYTYRMADASGCASSPTTCTYRKGDLWKVTNVLGQVTEVLKYDGAGRVLSTKDPNGVVTDLEYHPRGWLTARKERGPNNAVETDDLITRIEYWPTGLVKQVTQPDGAFTAYAYDAAHRLTGIADNAGNTIQYTLDNAGNRTREDTKDAIGTLKRTLSRVYDQLGQLQTLLDAQSNPTAFTYDANGNTETVTDALGRETDNAYDPLNRLKRTLQDVGGIEAEVAFEYDALDNLTRVTDPKGLDTAYAYNGLGELTHLTSPDTGITTYTHDSAGNRASQTDARGKLTTYAYDALNRLTGVAYATTSLNAVYTYDTHQSVCPTDERFPKGRLVKMKDGSGTTQYCYDRFGRRVRKVQTSNGQGLILRYAYTPAGQVQSLTYPDGTVVDYVRNALGQVTEVGSTRPGHPRQVVLEQAGYLPFGPVTGWSYGNGRGLVRSHDQDYRPTAIHDPATGGLDLGFGYDVVGNLDSLGTAAGPTPAVTFDYDALNRLTHSRDGTSQAARETYSYDPTGNRTGKTDSAGTLAYTYPSNSHRLTKVGTVARSHDAAGNTTAIGGTARQFVYDATGRMSQAKQGGVVKMNYRYNGRGEQVRRYLGTDNTYTLYDEQGRWLGDYDNSGAPIQQAIWLDDLPVGLLAGTGQQLHYVEPDHLGTPRSVIDPIRNVAVWRWELEGEAFGNSLPDEDPDNDSTDFVLDLRFPGQRYDGASGLNYNYFRDYEPATGRYVQSDPIGLEGGWSTYSYTQGMPLDAHDRYGLIFERCPDGSVSRFNFRNGRSYCPADKYEPPQSPNGCDGNWELLNDRIMAPGIFETFICKCRWVCRKCDGGSDGLVDTYGTPIANPGGYGAERTPRRQGFGPPRLIVTPDQCVCSPPEGGKKDCTQCK